MKTTQAVRDGGHRDNATDFSDPGDAALLRRGEIGCEFRQIRTFQT